MDEPSIKCADRPTLRRPQKRDNLHSVALEEFARVGLHAASLHIAEKPQVPSRTLYNHFPDKLSLFKACLEHASAQIPDRATL